MPFTAKDAKSKTKKAVTPKAKRMFAHVANSAMERGEPEGKAIKMASGVVKKSVAKAKRK